MRLSLTAGLIAAAAVSGCGASKTVGHAAHNVGSAVDAVAEASTTTQRQNTAQIRFVSQGTVNGQSITSKGSGVIQFRPSKAKLSLSAAAGGQSATLQEVMDGTTVYLRLPANARQRLPSGKSWIKVDLDKASGGAFGSALSQQQDPTSALKLMQQTSDVRAVGRERVDGVTTTHYRGTVDYAKIARSGPPALRKLSAQALRVSARSRVPVDVWIDGAKRVRRERLVFAVKPNGRTPAQTQTMTMDFVRFGVDASAIAPPAGHDVYDATAQAAKGINGTQWPRPEVRHIPAGPARVCRHPAGAHVPPVCERPRRAPADTTWTTPDYAPYFRPGPRCGRAHGAPSSTPCAGSASARTTPSCARCSPAR